MRCKYKKLLITALLLFIVSAVTVNYTNNFRADEPDGLPFPDTAFTIVVFPDTQKLVAPYSAEWFANSTSWVYGQMEKRNIVAVLHLGDVVDDEGEWTPSEGAWDVFWNNDVPNLITFGNHDYGHTSDTCGCPRRRTLINATKFKTTSQRDYWNNATTALGSNYTFGDMTSDGDTFYGLFDVTVNGAIYPFIIFSLQFAPHDSHIAFMNTTLNTYSDRNAIVITHMYVNTDNSTWGSNNFNCPDVAGDAGGCAECADDNYGDEIEAALRYHDNIIFCTNGHSNVLWNTCGGMTQKFGSVGIRSFEAYPAYQNGINDPKMWGILSNYQGNANRNQALRLYEFYPDSSLISVRTYEPDNDIWRDDTSNRFDLTYNLTTTSSSSSSNSVFQSINNQANNTVTIDVITDFNWTKTEGASYYQLQIANDSGFTDVFVNLTDVNVTNYPGNYTETGGYVEFTLPESYRRQWYQGYYFRIRSFSYYTGE